MSLAQLGRFADAAKYVEAIGVCARLLAAAQPERQFWVAKFVVPPDAPTGIIRYTVTFGAIILRRAGGNDQFMSIYLPYCDKFVTADGEQESCCQ